MKTLVLYANYSSTASYYDDWYDAFFNDSFFDIDSFDICSESKEKLLKKIVTYDLIVLLHSTNADNLFYLESFLNILEKRKAILLSFVGNEVNIPNTSMKERISILKKLEPDFIFTQLLEETGKWLYSDCTNSKVVSIPHALNSKSFFPINNLLERKIDIGVRSFKYDVHLGDKDRNDFFYLINSKSKEYNLNTDISFDPNKRFKRDEWANFLNSCKATIATEAGSFYLQKDDQMVLEIQKYLSEDRKNNGGVTINKNSKLMSIYNSLPKTIKEFVRYIYFKYSDKFDIKYEYMISEEEKFDEIYTQIIANFEKCNYYSKAISSRHFDAIGTKTILIMLEGRYNDILVANEHYLEIKEDYSNIKEQFEKFRDPFFIEKMATNTLEYILDSHQHKHRINKIKRLIS